MCASYDKNKKVKEDKTNILVQQYELFKIKEDEDIEIIFSRFQVLESGLQVLNKSYTTVDHVKNILMSRSTKYRPKLTAIKEAIDLNNISLESLVSNIQILEMNLIGDKPVQI